MNINSDYWRFFCWAPDDEGAGGNATDADGGTDSAAAAAGDSDAKSGDDGAKSVEQATPGVERPDWLQEKYWTPDKFVKDGKINYEELAKTQAKANEAAEKKIYTRTDALKKEVAEEYKAEAAARAPKSPDDYVVTIPDRIQEGNINVDLKEDQSFQVFKQAAFEHGVPQERFDELVTAYIDARLSELPNSEEEIKELGEHGEMRVDRVRSWAAKSLSKESYEFISTLPVTKNMTEFLENIMEISGMPSFAISEDTGTYVGDISKDDLKKLMDSDAYRNGDPDAHRKVQAGWNRLNRFNKTA